MKLTIDLDDRAWFDAIPVGGIGVRVVEGVQHHVQVGPSPTVNYGHGYGFSEVIPPPEWVALSEQKCETCGGRGEVRKVSGYGSIWATPDAWDEPCPDCLGSGRPLVQVTVPCDQPLRTMGGSYHPGDCCDGSGRVSIGSVTVEAVAIITTDSESVGSAYEGPACVEVNSANGYARYWPAWSGAQEYDDGTDVDLGPNPEQYVGKFGVIVRRRT